jgi:hypothetical protein
MVWTGMIGALMRRLGSPVAAPGGGEEASTGPEGAAGGDIKLLYTIHHTREEGAVSALVAYQPTDVSLPHRVVVACVDARSLKVYASDSGALLGEMPGEQQHRLVAYDTRDGSPRVASGSLTGDVRIFSGDTLEPLHAIKVGRKAFFRLQPLINPSFDLQGHTKCGTCLLVYHEAVAGAVRVVSGGRDKQARVIDGESGEILQTFTLPKAVESLGGYVTSEGGTQRLVIGGRRSKVPVRRVTHDGPSGATMPLCQKYSISMTPYTMSHLKRDLWGQAPLVSFKSVIQRRGWCCAACRVTPSGSGPWRVSRPCALPLGSSNRRWPPRSSHL